MSSEERLSGNLELWMTNLPDPLKALPIIYLAIPGSHDSFTSSINFMSTIAPDAEPIIQKVKFLGPLVGIIVSRWAKTQGYKVKKQLKVGIRYFDLRISTKKKTEHMYFVHGQYADNVALTLNVIANFLHNHPKEVVVLDCQHFYAFMEQDHAKLTQMFKAVFGRKLLLRNKPMNEITLDYMTESGYQVLVVYRNRAVCSKDNSFWPSSKLPNPWPETDDINVLIPKLNAGLSNRSQNVGYVSQCILTPTTEFVVKHIYRSLKATCVSPMQEQKYKWLNEQSPGLGGINIVIADFIDLNSAKFSKNVISLNGKIMSTNNTNCASSLTPIDNS